MIRALIAAMALIFAAPAWADDTMPPAPWAYRQLPDPAQEAKAKALMETLRCLKCQSQSIADSDAPLAGDMRTMPGLPTHPGAERIDIDAQGNTVGLS